DADIGRIPRRHSTDVARERKFRNVEFLVAEGAKENLLGIERQVGRLAAFHLHPAIPDGACAVVIAARDRYRHFDHLGPPDRLGGWVEAAGSGKSVLASVLAVKRRLVVPLSARYFRGCYAT